MHALRKILAHLNDDEACAIYHYLAQAVDNTLVGHAELEEEMPHDPLLHHASQVVYRMDCVMAAAAREAAPNGDRTMADTTTTPVNVHGGHTARASRAAWAGWVMGQVQAEKGSGLGLFDRSMAVFLSGYGHDLPNPERRRVALDSIKRVRGER